MVTPVEMREFADDCLLWATQTKDPSNRDLMIRVARHWSETASAIERRVANGEQLAVPDLRYKLD